MEIFDIILLIVGAVSCVLLWLLAGFSEKVVNTKWRLCYIIPAFLCILLVYIGGTELCMIPAYLAMAGLSVGAARDEVRVRHLSSVICGVLILITVPLCLLDNGYRNRHDYLGDFKKGFDSMKEHYALTEYKQIDFDALWDKYYPQFREVQNNNDAVENVIVWKCFTSEFRDGHVGYSTDDEITDKAVEKASGNDYGLVIVTLSDGRTVAAETDSSLESIGIHNGTEILTWEGMTPAEADKKSRYYEMNCGLYSDAGSAEFFEGIYAAGVGGDTAEVRYIDDAGNEQTAVLKKLKGCYHDRFEKAEEKLMRGYDAAHMSFTRIDDTTACLRIKIMSYDKKSSATENHSGMVSKLREDVTALMADGVKDIIIDIRSNGGGSADMVKGIASVFAPAGEHYYVTDALWDEDSNCYVRNKNGGYIKGTDNYFNGENILGDGRVILLVDAYAASAADHLTKVMQGMENVTVMGFTKAAGVGQGVYGIDLENGSLQYSSSVLLNKDGSIFIDAGTDHITGDDIDIKVPLDEEAFRALFDEDRDYLLEKALEQLKD